MRYERHQARVRECLGGFFRELAAATGGGEAELNITGSVGMGVSESCGLPFVQEVVAASNYVRRAHPEARTMIDIGGEDAKVVFFEGGRPADLRMNGNCAGGTGAFIDQTAILLGVSNEELSRLAMGASHVYPIASRCGVFCKTDIQNLVAKNIPREDIAASIFHAVAVQTVITLAHGCSMAPPVLFCGGPLTFLPALRKAFADYLRLGEGDMIAPENGSMTPAWGAALSGGGMTGTPELFARLADERLTQKTHSFLSLPPVFESGEERGSWRMRACGRGVRRAKLKAGAQEAYLGVDSGSTTTKVVALAPDGSMLYSYYRDNDGNPVKAVEDGLKGLAAACAEAGAELRIAGSCSTGYGEDLVRAAFAMDSGVVETIAHYLSAKEISPEVSFILDIGGQDMKAVFVDRGVINRIEINEACSSGCGSFISAFARSMGYSVAEFADEACRSAHPCDLGTRCTVFMNSKVKQVLREGASVADIAAGLSYSVVKNCLYKVLQLKNTSELGKHIVVQGGTMRNDSIVRALEKLSGATVHRSDCPELMGAVGCALYAMRRGAGAGVTVGGMLEHARFTSRQLHCKGCENRCMVTQYLFGGGRRYYSGNRCEKVFSNRGGKAEPGVNAYGRKLQLLFGRERRVADPLLRIGIPRCLNIYEEYPFWHTLLTGCGIEVELSSPSDYSRYEHTAGCVMSDNICFPAKLVHSHIEDLAAKGVDRIFMPFVVFEKKDGGQQNSYNCPIVSGYSEVVKSSQTVGVPVDAPVITFKDERLLYKQCREYLRPFGVKENDLRKAFADALRQQAGCEAELAAFNRSALAGAREKKQLTVMLAGRPYHTDPLIQHKVSDMIASMGVCVITDDIVRGEDIPITDTIYLSQWAYPNRIMKAAKWAGAQSSDVQFMQLTSFGCGPDAFLVNEVRATLGRYRKNLTLLKIDDVNNIGSIKLRVRSLVESVRFGRREPACGREGLPESTPLFTKAERRRKLIAPFFTPFLSPLIPSAMKVAGFEVENLPMSDGESCELGLKYSNNEVCYPATLIVGDVVKAFKSGMYNPNETAVIITQTGGQCRASNYVALIKRALLANGYDNTPVVPLSFGSGIANENPGFDIAWRKLIPVALATMLYSDVVAKLYYATVARECAKGRAAALRDEFLDRAKPIIEANRPKELTTLAAEAAVRFNEACLDKEVPKVGIVGEIFLEFNPFAQKNVTEWLISKNLEVSPPLITDFFTQSFVNLRTKEKTFLERKRIPSALVDILYRLVSKKIRKFNEACGAFRYFTPFDDIREKAEHASGLITLNAQFGEGWLISGEMAAYAARGINHVVSLQPFGCIANHIIEKGIEKRIKAAFPSMNILSLDFDSSVSDVNILNRLLLFIDSVMRENK